jgi:hypothetical protein
LACGLGDGGAGFIDCVIKMMILKSAPIAIIGQLY